MIRTLTSPDIISFLTSNTDGNTATNIYVKVTATDGFGYSKSYTSEANSLNIYCHQGGDCYYFMVECPEEII